MAIQEIRYGGMTAQPSDYECGDGELSLSLNMLNEDGHVKALEQPEEICTTDAERLIVHDTSKFKHYVGFFSTGTIKWIEATAAEGANPEWHTLSNIISGVSKVECLGNTLCVLATGGLSYLLWDAEHDTYKQLSPNLPELKLSFGLQCEFRREKAINAINLTPGNTTDFAKDFYSGILSCLNKNTAGAVREGKFPMPFFVRYAYKLYDGSHTLQSTPILMLPITGEPLTFVRQLPINTEEYYNIIGQVVGEDSTVRRQDVVSYIPACDLDMEVVGLNGNLDDYSDIITGVDIFVSPLMYTYDQATNGEQFSMNNDCNMPLRYDHYNNLGYYKLKNIGYDVSHINHELSASDVNYTRYSTVDALVLSNYSLFHPETSNLDLNRYEEFIDEAGRVKIIKKDLQEQIINCTTYNHLCTISLERIHEWDTRKLLEYNRASLQSLANHPALPDDNDSHCKHLPSNIYSYNQRLLEVGGSKELFRGYFNQQFMSHTTEIETTITSTAAAVYNGNSNVYTAHPLTLTNMTLNVSNSLFNAKKVYVYIRKEGKEYIVEEDLGDGMLLMGQKNLAGVEGNDECLIPWFYYPDPGAYAVKIRTSPVPVVGGWQMARHIELDLKPHDLLNGAYYFNNFAAQSSSYHPDTEAEEAELFTPTADPTYSQPNKLYTSEVLNPWYFPVEGVVTVGNGELTALSAATQALSQGQFGEFPLYAFCSDGVWALTVGATGYFTRSVPVSRDVCTNPEAVLQIDNAVVYPTDRGLMLLGGSTNVCFTEQLVTKETFDLLSGLPGMEKLMEMMPKIEALRSQLAGSQYEDLVAEWIEYAKRTLLPVPFREFLDGCQMVYDYVQQRIIVFNPKTQLKEFNYGKIQLNMRKHTFALVYSLKTNKWGMMESNLRRTVNSYPEALALTDTSKLVRFVSQPSASGQITGLMVTRPLKLGAADVLKTIRTIVARGQFERGEVKLALWGSRDLYHWYLVTSSVSHELRRMHGTPYKYFRIGVLSTLGGDKGISGATVEMEPKMTDVLR